MLVSPTVYMYRNTQATGLIWGYHDYKSKSSTDITDPMAPTTRLHGYTKI